MASNVSSKEKLYIFIFLFLVFMYCNWKKGKDHRQSQDAKNPVEKCLSDWDGSHKGMVSATKAMMNDPESFDHIETRYIDRGNEIDLIMKFKGTNKLGGVVTNTAKATINSECVLIYGPVIL